MRKCASRVRTRRSLEAFRPASLCRPMCCCTPRGSPASEGVSFSMSRIHFKSGPFHSLGLQVEAASPQGGGGELVLARSGGSWPVRRELTLRVATKDRFGNPTAWDQSLEGPAKLVVAWQSASRSRLTELCSAECPGDEARQLRDSEASDRGPRTAC